MFTRIQIQTVSWCNRSCAFCPSGKFPVDKTFMPLDVYHRVIDQLRDLNFDGRISPYLMNESLLDKRLPDLIAYARKQCPESWIAINTNGDALSESLAGRLFEAGLNCMDVNAYDDTSQYEAYLALAERIVERHPEIQLTSGYLDPNFNASDLTRHSKRLHCRDMSDWTRRFNDKLDIADMTNRSGNVPGATHVAEPFALDCERPFQQMYINHHGEAVLCCNDWRFEVVMGDTAESPLHEIWNNDKYRTYREHLQRQDRHLPLCASCDYRGTSKV
ncbi:radical SAM/SPASM domain-containing protein [Candidatus Entotheonella palauensis]|uniref:radical SAM/SPASM domain-containing protein n=1 Tax=Candidatus Entotheonella palauensis TaxID=93172 RepID=UPI000B7D8F7E|nr:radical SAM/SPASM domain-containing protein [Candidatus Entotheonella palauensis]